MNRKADITRAVIAILAVCLFMAMVSGCDKEVPLQVGQVWETTYSADPFKVSTVLHKVIALKNGYVQYERLDKIAKGVTGSMKENIFRAGGAKLINNEPVPYPMSGVPIEGPDAIIIPVSDPNGLSLGALIVKRPVWGKGELPPEWVEYFGDSNLSRMSFKQSQVIDALTSKVFEVSGPVDPNGVRQ